MVFILVKLFLVGGPTDRQSTIRNLIDKVAAVLDARRSDHDHQWLDQSNPTISQ